MENFDKAKGFSCENSAKMNTTLLVRILCLIYIVKSSLLKEKATIFFKLNPYICYPAFPGEKIFFNSKGLSHLFYKDLNKTASRNLKEVKMRVNLLPRALHILTVMPLVQEERKIERNEKTYYYYAFEGIVDDLRVKVVIKQDGDGKKHFWSVIPAWRRSKGERVNARNVKLDEKKMLACGLMAAQPLRVTSISKL